MHILRLCVSVACLCLQGSASGAGPAESVQCLSLVQKKQSLQRKEASANEDPNDAGPGDDAFPGLGGSSPTGESVAGTMAVGDSPAGAVSSQGNDEESDGAGEGSDLSEQQLAVVVHEEVVGSRAGRFVKGSCQPKSPYKTNECCPTGYEQIHDMSDCHAAMVVLEKAGVLRHPRWGGSCPRTHRPQGCMRHLPNNHVCFNGNRVDGNGMYGQDEVLCKKGSYEMGGEPRGQYHRDKGCPAGHAEIKSETACFSAMKMLGLEGRYVWAGTQHYNRRPTGCYIHLPNGHVVYNPISHTNGLYGRDKVLCSLRVMNIRGYWKSIGNINPAVTQCVTTGLEETRSEEEMKSYSNSVKVAFSKSVGVTAGPAGGASGETSVSAEFSHSWGETYKTSYSQKRSTKTKVCDRETHNLKYTWKWQWVFEIEEEDHHKDTAQTGEMAFTRGVFMPPRCLPGWMTDQYYYQTCHPGSEVPT